MTIILLYLSLTKKRQNKYFFLFKTCKDTQLKCLFKREVLKFIISNIIQAKVAAESVSKLSERSLSITPEIHSINDKKYRYLCKYYAFFGVKHLKIFSPTLFAVNEYASMNTSILFSS